MTGATAPDPCVWLNGELCRASETRISPFDHGLITGDGVFETLRVYRGEPFAMRRHLERLSRSAQGLGLPVPPAGEIQAACRAVVEANKLTDARLRITLTGGPSPLGSERSDVQPMLLIAIAAFTPWAPTVDVVTVPWRRNEHSAIAGLKTISYAENVVALAHAKRNGGGEAIFANTAGDLCEGTGTNVFLAFEGELITPPLESGCLAGVTRDLLLECGVARERTVPLADLAAAPEAFLTSSTREVHPVRAVDGATLPACPGPLTAAAQAAFHDLLARTLDP